MNAADPTRAALSKRLNIIADWLTNGAWPVGEDTCFNAAADIRSAVAALRSNAATDQPAAMMQPTYYVRHPDDSYSVADPQPVLASKAENERLHAEIERLRSTVTSEEVQQAAMFARKHVKSRTAGDGAYGEGEDCVALDLLDQLADLIESLARSEADVRMDNLIIAGQLKDILAERNEARAESAAHKADAERGRNLLRVLLYHVSDETQWNAIKAHLDAARGK